MKFADPYRLSPAVWLIAALALTSPLLHAPLLAADEAGPSPASPPAQITDGRNWSNAVEKAQTRVPDQVRQAYQDYLTQSPAGAYVQRAAKQIAWAQHEDLWHKAMSAAQTRIDQAVAQGAVKAARYTGYSTERHRRGIILVRTSYVFHYAIARTTPGGTSQDTPGHVSVSCSHQPDQQCTVDALSLDDRTPSEDVPGTSTGERDP